MFEKCPKCLGTNIYQDGNVWICPECSHEWNAADLQEAEAAPSLAAEGTTDAFGNRLADGDSVTVIKELRIKGSSSVVKVGTKVKNIRLGDAGDGHDISCKIDGLGSINLKSEYVKKV